MTTASAKNKGRKLQQTVRDAYRELGRLHGLEDEDVESRGMGQNNEDIIFTPAARKVFGPLAIECKNHEKLGVVSVFWNNYNKYHKKALPLLIHKRNGTTPLVTLRFEDYIAVVGQLLAYKKIYANSLEDKDAA